MHRVTVAMQLNHTCTLENVPLQAWANVIVTLNNRSLEHLFGWKTCKNMCTTTGVPKMTSGIPLVVSPNGGFEGYVSNVSYFSRAVNPREAYEYLQRGSWRKQLVV